MLHSTRQRTPDPEIESEQPIIYSFSQSSNLSINQSSNLSINQSNNQLNSQLEKDVDDDGKELSSIQHVEQVVDSDEDMLIKKKRMLMHQSINQSSSQSDDQLIDQSNKLEHDSDDELLIKSHEQDHQSFSPEPSTIRRTSNHLGKLESDQPNYQSNNQPDDELEYQSDYQSNNELDYQSDHKFDCETTKQSEYKSINQSVNELEYQSDDKSPEQTSKSSTTTRRKRKGRPKITSNTRRSRSTTCLKYYKDCSLDNTYSDPDDIDGNPNLLDCYKPSIVSSVPIIEYLNRHIKAFTNYPYEHLSIDRTTLCQYLLTTQGTLSGIISRKYPYKARGVVIRMREWLSSRDHLVVSLLYQTIRNQSNEESNNQSVELNDPPEQPDWDHPCMQLSNLSIVTKSINQSIDQSIDQTMNISLDQLVDFMKYDLSIADRGTVEDVIAEWIASLQGQSE